MMKILDRNKKNNIINIEDEDLNDAKLSTKDFSNEIVKKRAFINVLGARLGMKFFFNKKLDAMNAYSLYTIHSLLKDIDIADIYYNDMRIDVRLIFNRKEIFIPKQHYEKNMLPDLYMILELKENFTSAECLGFFDPKEIHKENANKNFYFIEEDSLISPNDIKKLKIKSEKIAPISEKEMEEAMNLFLPLTDNAISNDKKLSLYESLKRSQDLRERFVEFENFELISKNTANDDSILQDKVLGIIGAQDVYEEENLTPTAEKAEIIDEVLTDMLDEEIGEDYKKPQINNEDDDSFTKELEASTNKSDKSENKLVENAVKGVATGIGIGAVMAGSEALASQANMAQTGLEAVSKTVDLGSNIVENLAKASSNASLDKAPETSEISESIPPSNSKQVADEPEIEEVTQEITVPENKNTTFDLDSDSESAFNLDEDFSLEDLPELDLGDLNKNPIEESSNKIDFQEKEEDKNNDDDIIDASELDDLFADVTEDTDDTEKEEAKVDDFVINEDNDDALEFMDENSLEDDELSFESIKTQDLDDNENPLDISKYQVIEDESENNFDALSDKVMILDENDNPILPSSDEDNDENVVDLDEELSSTDIADSLDSIEENEEEDDDDLPLKPLVSDVAESKEMSAEDALAQKFKEYQNSTATPENEEENVPEISDTITSEEETKTTENTDITPEAGPESTDETQALTDDLNIEDVDKLLDGLDLSDEELQSTLNLIDEDIVDNSEPTEIETPISNTNEETQAPAQEASKEDETLKFLFTEGGENTSELPKEEDLKNIPLPSFSIKKDKKMMIIASAAGVLLVSVVLGATIISKNANQKNILATNQKVAVEAPAPEAVQPQPEEDISNIGPDINAPEAQGNETAQGKDMSSSLSDAFSNGPVNTNITKIAWEVPEDLAYNDGFRSYLQIAGKNLRLNLQNDLLLATEMAYANKVVIDIVVNGDGSLVSANIKNSSGSKQIDKIVLQSVKETLMYLKMPSSELGGKSVDATLIINF